jgi:hypothetical protein
MAKPNHTNWLKDSYKTHGSTTDGKSKPNGKNMLDTPKAKVAKIADKTTDMDKTSVKGNSSGGGKSSQRTTSAGNGGNAKYPSGLVGSRKQ